MCIAASLFALLFFSFFSISFLFLFFFNDTATTEIYTLSLHDALPILITALVTNAGRSAWFVGALITAVYVIFAMTRSEEHTSELQSLRHLVCRLLLEKKKKKKNKVINKEIKKRRKETETV